MREFSEKEKKIINRLVYAQKTNDLRDLCLAKIIDEELTSFVLHWDADYNYLEIFHSTQADSVSTIFEVISVVCLLKYLEENGLITVFLDNDFKDNYLYNKKKFQIDKEGHVWVIKDDLKLFAALPSNKLYFNVGKYVERYAQSICYPSQTLVDLVDNGYKTEEQIRFEKQLEDANIKHQEAMKATQDELCEAKNQTKYSQWAFVVSLIALVAAVAIPLICDTKLTEKDEIINAIKSIKTELPTIIETKITNDTIKVDVVKPTTTNKK